MKISIKATNVEITPSLREYVEEKIGSLEKFVKRWNTEDGVEVWVEVGRTTEHHRKGDVFRAEADLRLPGKILRAEEDHSDVRVAVDRVREKLQREIEKYKGIADKDK
jgi:putative sigma-54 modulation protein